MKKETIAAFVIIMVMSAAIYTIVGCSTGGSIPTVDIPDMPNGSNQFDVSGTWQGTWNSLQAGGYHGDITRLELEQHDAGDGSYNLSGVLELEGHPDFQGQIGNVTGTMNTGRVNFTADYGLRTIEFIGNSSYGSMSGTYAMYEGEEEIDRGNFLLTRDD